MGSLGTSVASSSRARNPVMFQGFEWYVPSDHQHWKRLEKIVPTLADLGIDTLWIPPACKGFGWDSVGYDIYDLYDLGEFDQKGTVATKYGTKSELVSLSHVAQQFGIGLIFDTVISHKAGADDFEEVKAVRVQQFGQCTTPSTVFGCISLAPSFALSFFLLFLGLRTAICSTPIC